MSKSNFKGYSLFTELESTTLRAYNRARLMVSMMEDNVDKVTKRVTPKGAHLVLQYFEQIPENERVDATKQVELIFQKKGINVSE